MGFVAFTMMSRPKAIEQLQGAVFAMLLRESPGLVYLFDTRIKGIKIGKTKNLSQRIENLKELYPAGILLHTIKTNVNFRLERFFQNKFSEKRRPGNGELFNLSCEDIAYFKSIHKVTYIKEDRKEIRKHLKFLLDDYYLHKNYPETFCDRLTKKDIIFLRDNIDAFDDDIRNKGDNRKFAESIISEFEGEENG